MSASKAPNPAFEFLRSFGRRKGRALPPYKQKLVDELLPSYTQAAGLPDAQEVWLEIGFGAGEHLYHFAKSHSQRHIVGAEPYLNGIAKLLTQLDEQPLDNLSIIADDVRPWLKALPPASLNGVYLLFPDPWPKTTHHKRRILNTALLDLIAQALKPNHPLLIATDHVDYSAWMMERILVHPAFTWTAKSAADWQTPFPDWTETRYQQKTTDQGRLPIFLEFNKNDD